VKTCRGVTGLTLRSFRIAVPHGLGSPLVGAGLALHRHDEHVLASGDRRQSLPIAEPAYADWTLAIEDRHPPKIVQSARRVYRGIPVEGQLYSVT